LLLPAIIIVGLRFRVFTPTEAAVVDRRTLRSLCFCHKGELVDLIQSARTSAEALIINPAALLLHLDSDVRRHEDF
jgi:TRAP-type C4-dicarboxylate transport system permease large subunit